ncbi:hypothetical protein SNOG_02201 [Parastagonospora nodorum SN15]|uniref:Uncharacterized protein n=1 Tax=Phaeosphaeria nodorum (strain SN15 / ATCC MYA-4574 / FGSC 10173) TaxID=321614 RepID=Q0V1B3_PHANO|nr:hypothetical protein SNOG_02201 [Parastagonospora nodorum SN15]EAT90413.1 hypothetical protein SNOG_02201 [Parastagonospora nodorum SN15]
MSAPLTVLEQVSQASWQHGYELCSSRRPWPSVAADALLPVLDVAADGPKTRSRLELVYFPKEKNTIWAREWYSHVRS